MNSGVGSISWLVRRGRGRATMRELYAKIIDWSRGRGTCGTGVTGNLTCLWRTSKRDRTWFFHTPGNVTFWRIGECRQSMPQTPSLNAQWKVGPSIQHNTCLDEMYTFLHPPPIFNSVYSRGPFIPWMPPKTVPPTMWPDRLRGWHPDTWWLKSPFILLFFNLLKLNKFLLFPIFSHFLCS